MKQTNKGIPSHVGVGRVWSGRSGRLRKSSADSREGCLDPFARPRPHLGCSGARPPGLPGGRQGEEAESWADLGVGCWPRGTEDQGPHEGEGRGLMERAPRRQGAQERSRSPTSRLLEGGSVLAAWPLTPGRPSVLAVIRPTSALLQLRPGPGAKHVTPLP